TGSVEFYKVDSGTMAEDMQILDGHDHYDTLVGALADPDAEGAERVAAKGVNFDDIPISDWKAGTNGKITRAFTFEGIQLLDLIPVR
ncbi:MAG: phage tail tube protein, partial [Oscillospiraceae bacterium]